MTGLQLNKWFGSLSLADKQVVSELRERAYIDAWWNSLTNKEKETIFKDNKNKVNGLESEGTKNNIANTIYGKFKKTYSGH